MSLKTIHRIVFAVLLPVALLRISAVALAGDATPLIDLSKLDASKLSTSHATVASKGDALSVRSEDPHVQGTVQFDVPEAMRDLSKRGFVNVDLENTGDKPLRFTFWALSGNGWGGASTWSTQPETLQVPAPDQPKPAGVEVLAAKERRTFQRLCKKSRLGGFGTCTKWRNGMESLGCRTKSRIRVI